MATTKRLIIGLTGKNAAGKGEVAEKLKELGFIYRSLSDVLREEAAIRKLPPTRENLIQLGQALRKEGGPGILAEMTIKKLEEGRHVIDSIRHPKEIRFLREAGNFTLIGVDAPVEVRFNRAIKRGRVENAVNLDEFKAMEARENSTDQNAQQLNLCLKEADIVLDNSGSIEELQQRVNETINRHHLL